MKKKKCSGCGKIKSIELFPINKTGKYGRYSHCKICATEKSKKTSRRYREEFERRAGPELSIKKKQCCSCKKTKSVSCFPISKGYKDGYHNRCRLCLKKKREKLTGEFEQRGGPDQNIRKKWCNSCKKNRDIKSFGICKSLPTGYAPFCKKCATKKATEFNKKNRVHIRAYQNRMRRENEFFRLRSNLSRNLSKHFKRVQLAKTKTISKYGIDAHAILAAIGPRPSKRHQLDHIFPVSAFDLTDPEQIKICYSPENLQWLKARENSRKRDKYDRKAFEKFLKRMQNGRVNRAA